MNQVTKPPIKCISVTLADLNAGMCKWVLAEDCYCGNPAAKWRAPYCVHHAAVAYTGRRLESPEGMRFTFKSSNFED
jgi:hypothetical protein